MFSDQDKDCVFMETTKNLNHHPHTYIECVPMPREQGDMAPIYFKVCFHMIYNSSIVRLAIVKLEMTLLPYRYKLQFAFRSVLKNCFDKWAKTNNLCLQKAIQEVGPEWAQNKKLVDLSKKDIRHSVSMTCLLIL